jgi:HEAT repeat protein
VPEERRALDAILAELGGKDAFHTLVTGLASADQGAANAAALAMRQHIKAADGRKRRSYLSEIEKFLAQQTKAKGPPSAIAAALKILGYLEDETAIGTLLSYAKSAKEPPSVRQEAFIAMRFALGKKPPAKVVEALVDACESPDRTLAQTALHTLGSLDLPQGLAPRLQKLVGHEDPERIRFVLELLGRQTGSDALKVLVDVVCTMDRRRAEMAAQMLGGKEAAVPFLAKALLETKDVDRGWVLRNVLRPMAKKISPAVRKELLETATERLGDGERGWEALLDVVRDADPEGVAQALRALASKLRKKPESAEKALTVMRLLCKAEKSTDDDRYALISLELARGQRDTRPAARAGDEALRMLGTLLGHGFDVAKALRTDRALGLEEVYYVGFHFAEEGHPLGAELLEEVVKKGGRAKIARMAKNKLGLSSGEA